MGHGVHFPTRTAPTVAMESLCAETDMEKRQGIASFCMDGYVTRNKELDWKTHITNGHSLKLMKKKHQRGPGNKLALTWIDSSGVEVMEQQYATSVTRSPSKFRFSAVCPVRNPMIGPTGNIVAPTGERTEGQYNVQDKFLVFPDPQVTKDWYSKGKFSVTFDGYDGVTGDISTCGAYNCINDAMAYIHTYLPIAYANHIAGDPTLWSEHLASLPEDRQELPSEDLRRDMARSFADLAYFKSDRRSATSQGHIRVDMPICFAPLSGMKKEAKEERERKNVPFLSPEWDVHGTLKDICAISGQGTQLKRLPVVHHRGKDIIQPREDGAREYLENIPSGSVCAVTISLGQVIPNPMEPSRYIPLWEIEMMRPLYLPIGVSSASTTSKTGVDGVDMAAFLDNYKRTRTDDDYPSNTNAKRQCSEPPLSDEEEED